MSGNSKLGREREAEGLAPDPFWYKSGVIYEVMCGAFMMGTGMAGGTLRV